jgi:hypothetical protein
MNKPVHLYDILEKLRAIAEKDPDPAARNAADSVARFNGEGILPSLNLTEDVDELDSTDETNAEEIEESPNPRGQLWTMYLPTGFRGGRELIGYLRDEGFEIESSPQLANYKIEIRDIGGKLRDYLKNSGIVDYMDLDGYVLNSGASNGPARPDESDWDKDEPGDDLSQHDEYDPNEDEDPTYEESLTRMLRLSGQEIIEAECEDDEKDCDKDEKPVEKRAFEKDEDNEDDDEENVNEDINITTTGDDAILAQILKLAGVVGGQTTEMLPANAPIGDKEGQQMGGSLSDLGMPANDDFGSDLGGEMDFSGEPAMTDQQRDPMGLGLPGEIPQEPDLDPIGLEVPSDEMDSDEEFFTPGLDADNGFNDQAGDMDVEISDEPFGDESDFGDVEVEEDFANTPDEHDYGIEDVTFSGDDMHKAKGSYSKVAAGDNPMKYDLQGYINKAEKKLGESQLDEISKDVLKNYKKKAGKEYREIDDKLPHGDSHGYFSGFKGDPVSDEDLATYRKRKAGINMAKKKTKPEVYGKVKVPATESEKKLGEF